MVSECYCSTSRYKYGPLAKTRTSTVGGIADMFLSQLYRLSGLGGNGRTSSGSFSVYGQLNMIN